MKLSNSLLNARLKKDEALYNLTYSTEVLSDEERERAWQEYVRWRDEVARLEDEQAGVLTFGTLAGSVVMLVVVLVLLRMWG